MNMSDALQKAFQEKGRELPSQPRPQQERGAAPPAQLDGPMPLPVNFVDAAEQVMLAISTPSNNSQDPTRRRFDITTSKIRNLLSLAIEIYHQEYLRTEETLLEESMLRIQMMRVRMLYEAGRDQKVKKFLQQSHLINYLKDIRENRAKLIRYTQYLEALVAYHRYYGGSEN